MKKTKTKKIQHKNRNSIIKSFNKAKRTVQQTKVNQVNNQNPKIFQANNQKTIVMVNGNNVISKGKRIRKKKQKMHSPYVEQISGQIFQLCNTEPKVYFRAVDSRPSALIQIQNKSDCLMNAIIYLRDSRMITQTIEREQQVSLDVSSLNSLAIECIGEHDGFCRGLYSLCLRHFFS